MEQRSYFRATRHPAPHPEGGMGGRPVDVERDHVTVVNGGDRAAAIGLRCDVAGHQAVSRTREAPVGEQRDLVADALADQSGCHLEHLAHPRASRGALVADHDDVAGLDALLLDHREALLL